MSLDYDFNRIDNPNGAFTAHIARFRIRTALNRTLTASAFLQYNSSIDEVITNVRIRYNPVEGSDLYVVYNTGLNTVLDPREAARPRLPRTQGRTLLVKYTYTFGL